jgi:hypothetical protein
MFALAWLPSWVWFPPLLNLCVRRRFGPVVGGCSDVDIVSWYLVFEWDVTEVVVWYDYGVSGLWLLDSTCIFFPGGRDVVVSMRVVVLVGFLSAATVGSFPTVFVGWVFGLVCGWSGLFEFFASLICASVLGFKSCFLLHSLFRILWVGPGLLSLLLMMYLLL